MASSAFVEALVLALGITVKLLDALFFFLAGDGIEFQGCAGKLLLKLLKTRPSFLAERFGFQSRLHRTVAFMCMTAITEAAFQGQGINVREGGLHRCLLTPELELTDPGVVENQSAVRQN